MEPDPDLLRKVRCPGCNQRFSPEPGVKTVKCPRCDTGWRISWMESAVPRIRGCLAGEAENGA
ncbi:MAG: hypothetical protein ACYTHM_06035 [Planctomycetota bacterium]